MARLEVNYASGLLLAAGPEEARAVADVLQQYASAFSSNEGLRGFLLDPSLPAVAKKEVLLKIDHTAPPKTLENFLFLLVDKRRIGLLPAIGEACQNQLAAAENQLIVKVISAEPLDKQSLADICEAFAKQHGTSGARLETETDPALIGGVRIQVGDMLYDGSLLGRLNGLRQAITEGATNA